MIPLFMALATTCTQNKAGWDGGLLQVRESAAEEPHSNVAHTTLQWAKARGARCKVVSQLTSSLSRLVAQERIGPRLSSLGYGLAFSREKGSWLQVSAEAHCEASPRPGIIRRTEWKTLGTKLLKDRKVVLHTDAAWSYKAKISGAIHDQAVHATKRVKRNGKYIWQHPKYVKVVTHKIPKSNKKIVVKSGTQAIDRCWRFLTDRVRVRRQNKAGSRQLYTKPRSARKRVYC